MKAETDRTPDSEISGYKNTGGKRNLQIRIEIPILTPEQKTKVPRSIFDGKKLKSQTNVKRGHPKSANHPNERQSTRVTSTPVIGPSTIVSRSISDEDEESIFIRSHRSSHRPEKLQPKSIPLPTTQQRLSQSSLAHPAKIQLSRSSSSRENRLDRKVISQRRQAPANKPGIKSASFHRPSGLTKYDTIVMSDDDGDEGSRHSLQQPQSPKSERSVDDEKVFASGKVIHASPIHKLANIKVIDLTTDVDSNDEDDILASDPTLPIVKPDRRLESSLTQHNIPSRRRRASPLAQHNIPSRRVLPPKTLTSSIATSTKSIQVSQNLSVAPPALLPSTSSQELQTFRSSIPDTDSEDDLAADQQLLRELAGAKKLTTKAAGDTAESILQRFQSKPLQQQHLSSSSSSSPPNPNPKPPAQPEPSKKLPADDSLSSRKTAASPYKKPSMTLPFPPGKLVRRSENHPSEAGRGS